MAFSFIYFLSISYPRKGQNLFSFILNLIILFLKTTPTSSTTTYDHQKSPNSPNFLSPNVMAALSAATGLSPQDINSWASNLPAGTTFKVTHHYDQSLAVSKAASTLMKQTSPSVSSPRGSIDHVFTR